MTQEIKKLFEERRSKKDSNQHKEHITKDGINRLLRNSIIEAKEKWIDKKCSEMEELIMYHCHQV